MRRDLEPGFNTKPRSPKWSLFLPAVAFAAVFAILTVYAVLERSLDRQDVVPQPTHYRININTAPVDELCLLPRVGPSIAKYIVEHREEVGPFDSLSELRDVRFIGEKTLPRIEAFARVK